MNNRIPCEVKLITISVRSSLENGGQSFHISLVRKNGEFFLRGKRMLAWESQDNQKITRKRIKVAPEWANGILDELRNANIPLLPEEVPGLDGPGFSMSVGSVFGGATYTWWSIPPKGWEILPNVTMKIISEFLANPFEYFHI